MSDSVRATYEYIGAFVDELSRSGVRHVCIAPGSRSTPLALTIAAHPGLKTWMHVDERSAGFFALGMARTLSEPVALLCTSGTASANFLPAVVEAKSAGVPLIVLTADRPPELRDVGSAQTIDQNQLFGAHAKWFVEVALPHSTPELLRYARTIAGRAAALACAAPAGPVHLNFPLREPLIPESSDEIFNTGALEASGRPNGAPWVHVSDPPAALDANTASRVAQRIRACKRPMFVCGPQPDVALAEIAGRLAAAAGAPMLADPLSQIRWGTHDRSTVIDRYDAILRSEQIARELLPDLVVRIGGPPTSKTLLMYLQRHVSLPVIVIDEARWPDPTLLAGEMIHANPRLACEAILESFGSEPADREWLDGWLDANKAANAALEQFNCALAEPFEGRALADVVAVMPDASTLFVSSSMPVRDLDSFGIGDGRPIRVMANRGANGIDGVVSTALGTAAALRETSNGRLVLVIGDLAFYHDMNGLLAAKLHSLDATIVILNNDGGGIFSFLPQSAHRDHFEQLFGTPHGLAFAPAAALYGGAYELVSEPASLRRAVADAIQCSGLHIIELRTERDRNVELHRKAWAAVAQSLTQN